MSGQSPANPPPPAPKPPQAGWLYERIHRSERPKSSWMPWLVASVVLHALIFGLLAMVSLSTGGAVRQPDIVVNTDIVEIFREEPVTRRSVITGEAAQSRGDRAAQLAEALKPAGEGVTPMGVDTLDLSGLDKDLLARRGPSAGAEGMGGAGGSPTASDLTRRVSRPGGKRDYKAVLDDLALSIADRGRRGRVTAVILFDESQSLLDARKLVSDQLERTFADLKFEITETEEKRIRWSVISFSAQPKMLLEPTRDISKVREAVARMPKDPAGSENVLRAIEFAVEKLATDRLMILLVSDEQGDDIGLSEKTYPSRITALQRTVDLCRKNKTEVYVLGQEAMLSQGTLFLYIEALKKSGYLMRGLPTCRPEVLGHTDRLGSRNLYIPSGFGCYSLSLLADRTGGRFFILSDKESPYDEAAMLAYEPEWCYPNEYDERTRQSPLRKAVLEAVEEAPRKVYAPDWQFVDTTWPRQQYAWTQMTRRIGETTRWCDKTIDELLALRKRLPEEKQARKRWEANLDLTVALLYKLKAMEMEYAAHLDQAAKSKDYPVKPPVTPEKRLIWRLDIPRDGKAAWAGGRDEQNARERATQALESVARTHANTPWAARAKDELLWMKPMRLDYTEVDMPYPPPHERPVYPGL